MRSSSIGSRPNYSCRSIRSPQRGITSRKIIERREEALLSPRAALSVNSRDHELWLRRCKGVHHKLIGTISVHTRFSADRERILDSKPFRAMSGKTQVLIKPKDETATTRLFHTIQVTQMAKTAGRALGLNEDLIEAGGLGHDLGHTPFGHAGERALSKFSRGYLGRPFLHNRQSLWVVEKLYPWMDISFEVRDVILRHSGGKIGMLTAPSPAEADDTLADAYRNPTTLEGCLIKVMDKIASAAQDFSDLLNAGLINVGFRDHAILYFAFCSLLDLDAKYVTNHPHALHEAFLEDIISNSRGKDGIALSPQAFNGYKLLRRLVDGIIRGKIEFEHEGKEITIEQSPIIKVEDEKAGQIVSALFRSLFNYYLDNGHPYFERPDSPYHCVTAAWPQVYPNARKEPLVKRVVALKTIDDIAEMTDRQALEIYEQDVLPRPLL